MSPPTPRSPRTIVVTVLLAASVGVVAFKTYSDILLYEFTATDTYSLIETGRIGSAADVARILDEPMMNGTGFEQLTRYYRPVASLSFGLDYALWNLNPFGYHFTNLILHVLVSLLVFRLLLILFPGRNLAAWLGSLLFATHPILVENVPAVSRRHDILAALFLLVSLIAFLRLPPRGVGRKAVLSISVAAYLLSLGSKEVSAIYPGVILVYAWLFLLPRDLPRGRRILGSVRAAAPFLVATALFGLWHARVVGGLGGRIDLSWSPVEVLQWTATGIKDFLLDLVYPVEVFRIETASLGEIVNPRLSAVVLPAVIVLGIVLRRPLARLLHDRRRGLPRALRILSMSIFILALLGLLVYPLVEPGVRTAVERAYASGGEGLIGEAMGSRSHLGTDHYVHRAREITVTLLAEGMLFSSVLLACVALRGRIREHLQRSPTGRTEAFLFSWFPLSLGLFLVTGTFAHRNMYVSVIPFAGILAILIMAGGRRVLEQAARAGGVLRAAGSRGGVFLRPAAGFLASSVVAAYLVFFSPLLRSYSEWRESGVVDAEFLEGLDRLVPEVPKGAVIHLYDLPVEIASHRSETPHAKSVAYLADYSIRSWLRLYHPGRDLDVRVHTRSVLSHMPTGLRLEPRFHRDGGVSVRVVPEAEEGAT